MGLRVDSLRGVLRTYTRSIVIGGMCMLSVASAFVAYADDALLAGFTCASSESVAVRLEMRAMTLVAPRVVSGVVDTVSSNGLHVSSWDTTASVNGWHEVSDSESGGKESLLVLNPPEISVEGGRLQKDAVWSSSSVHLLRHRVIVPNGVTLTVEADTVVKFGELTGITVESGGTADFRGGVSAPVILTHFADDTVGGNSDYGATNPVWNAWDVTVEKGGTVVDVHTQVRYGNVGSLPVISMPLAATAPRSSGKVRILATFNETPEKSVSFKWRAVDGTAKYGVDFTKNEGTAVWSSGATVYFDIPLVKHDDVEDVRTFSVELLEVEGANPNPVRLVSKVAVTSSDQIAPVPVCAESDASAGIRLETRNPDPQPEPVPETMAVCGGRLTSDETWSGSGTNFILNTVVVPSGVTLTVATNGVVFFAPHTGIKVEPGGSLNVVGSPAEPVLFTAANANDWMLSVVDGGFFADSYCIFEKTTIARHPTISVPKGCEVSERDGHVRVPVSVNGDRTGAFRVKWRAVDGTAKFGEDYALDSGEIEWSTASEGTKYITIPIFDDELEESSEKFDLELLNAQGANLGASFRCTVLIRDGTATLVPVAVCSESDGSEAIRLETREPDPIGKFNPETSILVGGRLSEDTVWDASVSNFVLNAVVVPDGVALTVVTNAHVRFAPHTGIKVEPGGVLRTVGSPDGPVVFSAER